MLIKYNNTNLHALSTYDGKDIKWLKPGWNEFDSTVWVQHEKDPSIQKMIADGVIELMAEKVKVKEGGKTVTKVLGKSDEELNIKHLDEKKAIEVVEATWDRDMLQRWADEETRHKVKRAVDKQLKPLLPESQTSTAD